MQQLLTFYAQVDESGISNEAKTANAQIIRRIESTDTSKSFENSDTLSERSDELPLGIVVEDGKIIGFGINIFNEDVYPLQSFEIYLRGIDLVGELDLSGCKDMVFVDVYRNRISKVDVHDMPSLRILGLQDNCIEELDPSELLACQGIDIGKNYLRQIDISNNEELVELYVNDNALTHIEISNNPKLKYFYCHNNQIGELDTRSNTQLRHLNATGNPMTDIWSLAPQRDANLPLELHASEGGYVGLMFNPIYNAQWKETGEWEQSYYAYPHGGWVFEGWYDENNDLVNQDSKWNDEYGTSRVLTAHFKTQE